MHHDLLRACLPCVITLAVLCALLPLVLRLSGGRLCLARLRDVHRCEAGGVQSLAFVITLPIFLMIVLFIVQVALLMIGLITVSTAAFAAARSAAVWIPAHVSEDEQENRLPPGIAPGQPKEIDFAASRSSSKYSRIFDAAVLACVPIAPSRAVAGTDPGVLNGTNADEGLIALYSVLVPSSASNTVLPQRLRNKLAYCLRNTRLVIRFEDKNAGLGPNSSLGPTYNPPDDALPDWKHINEEVGWQDPVTIEVQHHFALLPGPGRFLSRLLTRYDGRQDDVAPMIDWDKDSGVHKTWLRASATLTVEGIKSVRPYQQSP